MWNFREVGTWGFIRCSNHVVFLLDWVLLFEGAGQVIVVCVLASSHRELPLLLAQVEIGTWFGSEDRGGYGKHFGPVYSVKRNPFHVKFFLSVGDWCGKMWMEELKGGPLKMWMWMEGWFRNHPTLFWLANWSKLWKGPCNAGDLGGVLYFFLGVLTPKHTPRLTPEQFSVSNTPWNRPVKRTPKGNLPDDTPIYTVYCNCSEVSVVFSVRPHAADPLLSGFH